MPRTWDELIDLISLALSQLAHEDFEIIEYLEPASALDPRPAKRRKKQQENPRYGQCMYIGPTKRTPGGYMVEVGAKNYGGRFRDDGFPENPEAFGAIGFRRYLRTENWRIDVGTAERAARALVLGMRDGRECTDLGKFSRQVSD